MVRKLHLLLTLMLLAVVNTAMGAEETINLANGVYDGSQITWSGTSCTITQARGSSTTNVNKNYIAAPRWYKSHDVTFAAKEGYIITGATVVCTTAPYANALQSSTFSNGASASVNSSTVTITTIGDFNISMGSQSRISSVTVNYELKASGNQTATTMSFPQESYEFMENSSEAENFMGADAVVKAGNATLENATITYAVVSDPSSIIAEFDNGALTLDKTKLGTATIRATYAGDETYGPSVATYTIRIKHQYNGEGTANNPYNVADVYYMFKNNDVATGEVHVKGIVSKVEKFNSQYGSINYYLSDDGTDTNHFECYGGLGINGTKFISVDDITLGDIVVAKGILKEYNSTYEFDKDNEIVSWKKGVKLNISDALYSTMYYSDRTVKVPEGVEAYTYTIEKNGENDVLKNSRTYTAGDVLPAGSAVVLYAATAGNYIFKATEEKGLLDDTNVLKGSDEAETTAGGTTYYRLTKQDGKVGFAWGAENGAAFQNAAHKAYLPYTPSVAGAKVAFFALNGETTGINTIVSASTVNEDAALYNLKGQRVNAAYKGIVIQNGKKFINK